MNELRFKTFFLCLFSAILTTFIYSNDLVYGNNAQQTCIPLYQAFVPTEGTLKDIIKVRNRPYRLIGVADLFDVQRNSRISNESRHLTPAERELNIRFETHPELLDGTHNEFAELKRVAAVSKKEAVKELFMGVYFYYHAKKNISGRASIFGHSIMEKVSDYYVNKFNWKLVKKKDWKFDVNEYDGLHQFFTDDILKQYEYLIRTAKVDSSNPDFLDIFLENGRLIRIITANSSLGKYSKMTKIQQDLVESKYREYGYFDDPAILTGLREDKRQMDETQAAVPILVFEPVTSHLRNFY